MEGYSISFGPYRLLEVQRLLLEGDRPVRLGSRAFDILSALVERAGEVVGKDELIARAWPKTYVEDANLKMQMSALRRALGDGHGGNRYVITVPGRGYNFVAPVRREETLRAASAPPAPSTTPHNLPFAVARMIGRADAVAALVTRLSRERLVTIVGAGGIGKTTVALAVTERMMASYEHGVWLVDLAPLGDPRLVPSAVATVLGLEIRSENPLHGLVAAIRDKRMLLLLDNCEHVIDAAAGLAAAILSGAPGVNILATSREPLGVAGEREYRLASLGIPQASSISTAAEAAAFPAVQLFVERASAIVEDFALTDANAPAIVEICRKLDGLPLAIEFAAPRVEVLGVEGLAARLDDSLQLLGTRRRTGMPRHRTMRAVVDWSYGLLAEDEQEFLRSLGIFAGGFTVEAAAAVVPDAATTRNNAIDHLADLVAKSLVVVDVSGTKPRFRLLDTTRAYVLEKLDESGERERIARRHAACYRDLFERAEGEAPARPAGEWLADYAREIDNLRAALDWAFSQNGDSSIGIALTSAAVPLWMHLSLLQECRSRVERALAVFTAVVSGDARREMKLHAARSASLGFTGGTVREILVAYTSALDLAERVSDVDYQLRALFGLWIHETRGAVARARQFAALAVAPADRLVGERMIGISSYSRGNHSGAKRHLERVIAGDPTNHSGSPIRFQFDQQLVARAFLALILWLQGFPKQATRMAEDTVERARAADHANSLCQALARAACPIALWVGDLELAERNIGLLRDCSTRHALTAWHAYDRAYQGMLLIRRGDLLGGIALLRAGFKDLDAAFSSYGLCMFIGELAEALAHIGQLGEALATVDEAIERSGRAEEGWIMAELLRVKGELLRLGGTPEAADSAKGCFLQALQLARTQDALSWELRVATSLAAVHNAGDRSAEAIGCLRPVYGRFTEGFDTADLIAAKQLLDELCDAGRR